MKIHIFKAMINDEIIHLLKNGIIIKGNKDRCYRESDFSELDAIDMILTIDINPNILKSVNTKAFKFNQDKEFEVDAIWKSKIGLNNDIETYGLGQLIAWGFREIKLKEV